jgi:hypothetical protein
VVVVVAYFKVLFQRSLDGTERITSHISLETGRDYNQLRYLSKYKFRSVLVYKRNG